MQNIPARIRAANSADAPDLCSCAKILQSISNDLDIRSMREGDEQAELKQLQDLSDCQLSGIKPCCHCLTLPGPEGSSSLTCPRQASEGQIERQPEAGCCSRVNSVKKRQLASCRTRKYHRRRRGQCSTRTTLFQAPLWRLRRELWSARSSTRTRRASRTSLYRRAVVDLSSANELASLRAHWCRHLVTHPQTALRA